MVWRFATRRAAWIVSFATTRTPRPTDCGSAATLTALWRLAGPSAPSAPAWRIAPVRITGMPPAAVRSKKNAVSSMVSVPWVITTASAAPLASATRIRARSANHTLSLMSCEPTAAICSASSAASVSMPGAPATRSAMDAAPDLYPIGLRGSASPAIVPPVPRIRTRGCRAGSLCTVLAMCAIEPRLRALSTARRPEAWPASPDWANWARGTAREGRG